MLGGGSCCLVQERFPFEIVRGEGGFAAFRIPEALPSIVSPVDVGAHVLRHLKAVASATFSKPISYVDAVPTQANQIAANETVNQPSDTPTLSHSLSLLSFCPLPLVPLAILFFLRVRWHRAMAPVLRKVVMAVPAEFNTAQRNATIAAAEAAGLSVLRLLTEPTAAALAYGIHNTSDIDHVLVFDFGGGTLDVSILHVEGGVFTTLAVAGDRQLGGQDLTHTLFEVLVAKFAAAAAAATARAKEELSSSLVLQALREHAERAKIALSSEPTVTVSLPSFADVQVGFLCVRMCLCLCVRACVFACVCVCVCACVYSAVRNG